MNDKERELNHPDHCDCGCDHEPEEEPDRIYLTMDDDSELECQVLGIFEVEEKEYIALLPEEEGAVLIYGYQESPEGEPELTLIEDDGEFDRVTREFNRLFDEEDEEEGRENE